MTASNAPLPDDIAELSFEDALKRLEEIVAQLEGGNVPLEKSIEIYTRGDLLRKHCEGLLKSAETKVEKIVVRNGEATDTEPLDVD